MRLLSVLPAMLATVMLGAGAHPAAAASQDLLAGKGNWKVLKVGSKPKTRFALNKGVLDISADKSVAFLYREINPLRSTMPKLQWQWRVDRDIPATDLSAKGKDDRPAAVHLWFEDKSASVSGALSSLLGKPRVGYLMTYVWGGKQRAGSIIKNPYFPDKGMVIVLRDSRAKTGTWEMETRDIAADFRAAFGIAPKLSDLRHVSVSADTEDTRTSSRSSIRKFRIVE